MSSVFTFNPSPPRLASPWANADSNSTSSAETPKPLPDGPESIHNDAPGHLKTNNISGRSRGSFLNGYDGGAGLGVHTKDGKMLQSLESEPQMGPTEYKLSLVGGGKSEARLEQLTTQLLWRLQQSSSYHASSLRSKSPEHIGSLIRESQGALYEIGVADDGTFVGLSEDELVASLEVLRTMAAKLGCTVKVLRRVSVGSITRDDVERAEKKLSEYLKLKARIWANERGKLDLKEFPSVESRPDTPPDLEKFKIPAEGDQLWVAEAFVKPGAGDTTPSPAETEPARTKPTLQLRISLTGATGSGKSTLLGTLTTGELDNGRGKSRLSLLRHRHELASGLTSSVAWGLVGYRPEDDDPENMNGEIDSRIVNYKAGNISSWTDIHSAAEGGRIVCLTDSAGHPKFRRTFVRSVVGWAPHYAALLIPADEDQNTEEGVGDEGLSELSEKHLEICDKLGLRMIVVFTKIDVGTNKGMRKILQRVLACLRERGRKPLLIDKKAKILDIVQEVEEHPGRTVPVVFTSSVNGKGIDVLHELLMRLPIPEPLVAPGMQKVAVPDPGTSLVGNTDEVETACSVNGKPDSISIQIDTHHHHQNSQYKLRENDKYPVETLYHIDEVFGLQPTFTSLLAGNPGTPGASAGAVVSGYVKYGSISVGDELVIGPLETETHNGNGNSRPYSRSRTPTPSATPNIYLDSPGQPRTLSRSPESGDEGRNATSSRRRSDDPRESDKSEWRVVKVVSVRRLRLPVTTLSAGEAGTLGIIPVDPSLVLPSRGALEIKQDSSTPFPDYCQEDGGVPLLENSNGSKPINILTSLVESNDKGTKVVTFATPLPPDFHIPADLRLRKGMVILNRSVHVMPKAHTGFTAVLTEDATSLIVGSNVAVYIASVRVMAKVISVEPPSRPPAHENGNGNWNGHEEGFGIFGFDDEFAEEEKVEGCGREKGKDEWGYGFEFLRRGVWIEDLERVLVMPGAGKMEGFVGRVVERWREERVEG
ncbi:hypothetical protein RUND412_006222 [Rhizina undulata]